MKKKVCVVGDGAWGTAIANVLAGNGHSVTLWCNDPSVVQSMQKTGMNERYLPGALLERTIVPTPDISCVQDAEIIFEAVPVKFLRSVLEKIKPYVRPENPWVILSKGIETDTLLLPIDIVTNVLGPVPMTVLSGPSFAHDVVRKYSTAVALAASDCNLGKRVQTVLANEFFKPYISLDLIGVQVGGALKNVITLGIGMLDAHGYTDNPKAYFLTRGLRELALIAQKLGGSKETIYGLSGFGDLVLTALGTHSKNLALGRQLGSGIRLQDLRQEQRALPEGINTVASVYQLAQRYDLSLPICTGLYEVIFQEQPIESLMEKLMSDWQCGQQEG